MGKLVEMEIIGLDFEKMSQVVVELWEIMNNIGGFVDVEDL